jgi:hypothetical protein
MPNTDKEKNEVIPEFCWKFYNYKIFYMENANLQSEEVVLTAQKIYRRNLL